MKEKELKENYMKRILVAVLLMLICMTSYEKSAEAVIRLGVAKFQSGQEKSANTVQSGQLDLITDSFINTLAGSKSIAALERSRFDAIAREQKMSLSGLVDTAYAVKIGKLAGCQYMIVGSVYQQERANIVVRVVDVSTGEIYFSMSESGSSLTDVVSVLGNRVREEIAGEYAYVSEVRGRNITISRGSKDGVRRGDLYRVYADGTEIFDAEGQSLGHNVIDIAIVRIKDARANFSVSEIVKNGGRVEDVRRGSKAENISEEYAQELISGGVFSAKRSSSLYKPVAKTKPKPEEKKTDTYKPAETPKREEKIVKNPNVSEQFNLGLKYYLGRDYGEAARLFHEAADKGHSGAQYYLGKIYYNGGVGVKQNYTEALKFYRISADNGYTLAQCELGLIYYFGRIGVTKNYDEAVKLFSKAAHSGNSIAQFWLGWMYFNGEGLKTNYTEAFKWYSKSSEQKFGAASYELAGMYEYGYGTEKNIHKAIELYRESFRKGIYGAREALKRLGAE